VWQGHDGNDWEIFLYNVATGEGPVQITNNGHDDISPQTDGNHLVWLGFGQSDGEIFLPGGEIFLCDMSSREITQITNDSNVDSSPQIANGRVVWTSHQVTDSVEPGEIMLFEIGAQTPTALSASVDPNRTLDDSFPRINDTEVIWVQADGSGNTTLFMCDLTKRKLKPKQVPDGFVWEGSPQTDGDLTVLSRYDGNDREIFLYDSNSRKYHQITDNGFEDSSPRISGNYIAWIGGEGQASDIFLAYYDAKYITLVSPEHEHSVPKKPPATFSWTSAGYDKFKIQFSEDLNFDEEKTLTFPRRTGKWLSETSFIPKNPEWSSIIALEQEDGYVLWRVQGKDAEGNEGFSQVWSFSIGE
jgi:Tol biopolymer transport system component